jgi:AcrR family transcriptional regulator
MRVTAQVQAATREKIVEAARQLFASQGFHATTTREIARAAGLATGTMFNYFSSKEAIVGSLASEALAEVRTNFDTSDSGSSFEEALFAFVAAGLRKLKPFRKHLPALLGTMLSPACLKPDDDSNFLRASQLEVVAELANRYGVGELPAMAEQMYWSLYTGVLLFWANDTSPRQEDTLALLDGSLEMFVSWLLSKPGQKEKE